MIQPLHKRNFLLHLQERTGYDHPVLLKGPALENPPATQIEQLHNEYDITIKLTGVAGVRPLYGREGTESRPVLLLEYIAGKTLAGIKEDDALDIEGKLTIAVEIAGILHRIHERQVIHKDINSNNILIGSDRSVHIIDFGIATLIGPTSVRAVAMDETLAGNLAYISPEQTGRINRPVDYRTDLYSAGVTLYELFTGQLPFQSNDALEMIHNHIARRPTPPADKYGDIPPSVSEIILKLIAKDAQDRYQTAHGLHVDLQHCLDQIQATGQIEAFKLGRDDFSDRLQIPAKLYGRETELTQLLETFERVGEGDAEVLFVAGYAGVGKTSLVQEIQRPITEKGGYFIEGKFDQYQQNIPYSAWGQAFASLVDLWLTESETSIDVWKTIILEAVGENGRVLIDLIPNLERIIGPQPNVPELRGIEAKNRFHYILQRFISTVARPGQPLVIFLDDLQWIDLASLKLFDILLSDSDSKHYLMIGAYRDNQVDVSHPLTLELSHLKEANRPYNQLAPNNLSLEHVNTLLSDTLRMPPDHCLPLARLIYAKTDGNAFFTRQLLHTLAKDGLLSFENQKQQWCWDMTRLNKLAMAENVVDLMLTKLQSLPAASREILQVAACLGTQFEPTLLHRVLDKSEEEIRLALQVSYQEGLVVRIDGSVEFTHDRIQQTAYSLVPDHNKPLLHRRIGQILLAEMPVQAHGKYLFDLVGHLNMGIPLIERADEQHELVELNAEAAKTALNSTAYAAALGYAQTAIHLLGDDAWGTHYKMMLGLHLLAAEAAYLNVDYDQSEQHIEAILTSAHSDLDKAPAYVIQIESYNTQHQLQAAIEIGLSALQVLDVPLQEKPSSDFTIEVIRDLPVMSDQLGLAATEILSACIHPAYVSRPDLLSAIIETILHLTIANGLTPAGCFAIVSYAAAIIWHKDIEAACDFGRLGLRLNEQQDDKHYSYQAKTVFDCFLLHWQEHFSKVKTAVEQDIQTGFEAGNWSYLGTNLITATVLNVLVGNPLAHVQETMERNLRRLEQVREQYRSYDAYLWTQFVAQLQSKTEDATHFAGPYFVEELDLPEAEADNIHNTVFLFHTLKSVLYFHFGYYRAAYASTEQAEPQASLAASSINLHLLPFYQSLALLQFPERQAEHLEKLETNIGKLRLWSKHAPMNFQHKLDMVMAERERVAGNTGLAIDHYEQAIIGARQNGFLQDEALANELFGRFWHERGNEKIAQLYLSEAHALYRRWGAGAIVIHLEDQFPQWLMVEPIEPLAIDTATQRTSLVSQSQLDWKTILRASQTISGELNTEKLLAKLMPIIMENAGAQRAYLILERDGQWIIEAVSDVEADEVRVLHGTDIADSDQVSSGVVHYVARTQQLILLNDAASAGQFVQDPIIQRRLVKSLLCLPLVNQGQLSGILYLENNLAANVFTPERVELLKLLSSQMAISIDHAWLHKHLEDEIFDRTQALSFAEEQIRTLFESSQVGIGLTTVEGKVLAANKALQQMLSSSEEEMLQSNVVGFYFAAEQQDDLLKKLSVSRSVNSFGAKLKSKDGTPFFANLNVSKIIREGQEVILTMIEDVTEQVELNERLQREIDERKQVEQKLQTQIALVDGLLDAAVETVEIWDAHTLEYIKWNKTFRQLTGYSDDEIAALNPVADFFDDADLARAETAYEGLLREGQATAILTQIMKDGSRIPLEYTGAVTHDIEGNPKHVIIIGRDITERMQAEEQLRFQAHLLDAVGQAVVVTDTGGHVLYWNPFAEKLYGWSADEAMGMVTNELMMNDGANQQQDAVLTALLLSGKSWSGEYPAFHRDGTPLSIEATITPVLNEAGDPIFAIGISNDISERKQAEEALRISEEEHRNLVETINDVIYSVDSNGVITFLNPAVELLIGQPAERLVGKTFTQFIHSEDLGRLQDNVKNLLSGNTPSPSDYRVVNASGETRWVRATSQPVTDGDRVTGLQGVLTDITERKKLEGQLEEAATTAERDRLARRLHDAITQSLFSASVIAEATPRVWSKDPAQAQRNMDQLTAILRGTMAEMRAMVIELRPAAVSGKTLGELLRTLVEANQPRLNYPVSFVVEGDRILPEEVTIALYRIAQEAFHNVVQHADATEVDIKVVLDQEGAMLNVRDNGRGFDQNIHSAGHFGLSIMAERATEIGGNFIIESKPGAGTQVIARWTQIGNHEES